MAGISLFTSIRNMQDDFYKPNVNVFKGKIFINNTKIQINILVDE